MEIFKYGDYIRSIHTVRLHSVMSFMEESTKYERKEKNTEEIGIKNMINNREEACFFLTQNMQFDFEVSLETLEKWNGKIEKRVGTKKPDGIYKMKNKDIYIVLEYKDGDKNNMHYTMLNYCIELMRKILNEKNNINMRANPKIIPIVVQKYSEKIDEEIEKNDEEKYSNKKEFIYNVINI